MHKIKQYFKCDFNFCERMHNFVRHHFVKLVHKLRNQWEYQALRNQLRVLIGYIMKIYIPLSPSYFCRFHRNDTLRRQMVPPCHMKAGPRPNWEPWIRTTACHIIDFALYFIYCNTNFEFSCLLHTYTYTYFISNQLLLLFDYIT